MATLTETPTYTTGIYQLERADAVDAGTSGSGISNKQAKDLANRTAYLKQFVITGEVRQFAFSAVPTGFLICDGSAISRTTYSDLFAAIGVTFGAGNGTTTFNIPNLQEKFIRGAGFSHTVGTTEAATIVSDYANSGTGGQINIPVTNGEFDSSNNAPKATAAGTYGTTVTNTQYRVHPDNVSILMAIKT